MFQDAHGLELTAASAEAARGFGLWRNWGKANKFRHQLWWHAAAAHAVGM
jgi:hypothetical protein